MMCTPTQDVWQPAGCVSCELVCVCVSLVRVVIIYLSSVHPYRVGVQSEPDCSSPSYIRTWPRNEPSGGEGDSDNGNGDEEGDGNGEGAA